MKNVPVVRQPPEVPENVLLPEPGHRTGPNAGRAIVTEAYDSNPGRMAGIVIQEVLQSLPVTGVMEDRMDRWGMPRRPVRAANPGIPPARGGRHPVDPVPHTLI